MLPGMLMLVQKGEYFIDYRLQMKAFYHRGFQGSEMI